MNALVLFAPGRRQQTLDVRRHAFRVIGPLEMRTLVAQLAGGFRRRIDVAS